MKITKTDILQRIKEHIQPSSPRKKRKKFFWKSDQIQQCLNMTSQELGRNVHGECQRLNPLFYNPFCWNSTSATKRSTEGSTLMLKMKKIELNRLIKRINSVHGLRSDLILDLPHWTHIDCYYCSNGMVGLYNCQNSK